VSGPKLEKQIRVYKGNEGVMRLIILSCILIVATNNCFAKASEEKEDTFVQKCHDGYSYVPASNVVPTEIYVDMNGDGSKEEILGFQMRSVDDGSFPRAFVYVFTEDGEQTIPLNEYLGSSVSLGEVGWTERTIDVIDLNEDGKQEVVIWSSGGMHYHNVMIIGMVEGRILPLFMNGSACPIEYNVDKNVNKIKIGRADWDNPEYAYSSPDCLWEVWEWKGQEFVYSKDESTAPLLTETEELERYLRSMLSGKRGPPEFYREPITFDSERERKEYEYTIVYARRGKCPGFTKEHIEEIFRDREKYFRQE